jgi:hypothetical protein
MLNEEQASDLKSHIEEIVRCELAVQSASLALSAARRNLDIFIYKLEHPEKS